MSTTRRTVKIEYGGVMDCKIIDCGTGLDFANITHSIRFSGKAGETSICEIEVIDPALYASAEALITVLPRPEHQNLRYLVYVGGKVVAAFIHPDLADWWGRHQYPDRHTIEVIHAPKGKES